MICIAGTLNKPRKYERPVCTASYFQADIYLPMNTFKSITILTAMIFSAVFLMCIFKYMNTIFANNRSDTFLFHSMLAGINQADVMAKFNPFFFLLI